ncbi:MAG: peptidylprolyl isomerase [Alphaproteobacteria bacterium]|uniref:peptidylprolyl isomerase n=1 Tax=Candidatus Nitrobium versatile TaxID=2884831 RepID=A0A953J6E0_9BACT|nr:peptidylprolyl isomerase [Candidatus Nitrobium versatile]
MKKLFLLMIALVFAVSCTKGGGSKSDYVVKIDNTQISREDAQAEMNSLPDMARQFFSGPEGTSRFVDELVKKEMLYLEAKKRKMDQDKDFQRKLEEFKKITLINQLLEKEIEAASKITDKDVQAYYDSHKDDFMISSQVKISQILVKTEDDAKKVYERIKAGEDFAKVASEMSTDKGSAKAGGNIGSFKRGELAPELEETVFRLKKGEVGMPVKLKDGIHIIKVTDAKGTAVEFDKVKGLIGQKLTADKQKASFDTFIESLKKNYKVEINKEAVAKLAPAPAPAAPAAPHALPQPATPDK